MEVFCGELEAVPVEAAYDVVVIVGVLEYVGGGDGVEQRAAFLRRAAGLLRSGGAIVCAIENRLGVKYLAGAPEDHANLPFEGIEGYPHRGPHRTFARRELTLIFQRAGLKTRMLHAFPDYKTPRVVFSDDLLASPARALAWNVPRFPSRDSPLPRGRLAAEGPLWRGIVSAGLGGEFANSFVVLATRDGADVWPSGRLAVYWSTDRAAAFRTQTTVEERPDEEIVLRRRHLVAGPDERVGGPLAHLCDDTPFIAGPTLTDALAESDAPERERLLRLWRAQVESITAHDAVLPLDPQPDNFILTADGLRLIDDEWRYTGADARFVLERCLLYLGCTLAQRCPPEIWASLTSIGELVLHLGEASGLPEIDLNRVARREGELQALVAGVHWERVTESALAAEAEAGLQRLLARPLAETQFGEREPQLRVALQAAIEHERERTANLERRLADREQSIDALRADIDTVRAELDTTRAELDTTRAELDTTRAELDTTRADLAAERGLSASLDDQLQLVYASRTWRLGAAPRRVAAALRAARLHKP